MKKLIAIFLLFFTCFAEATLYEYRSGHSADFTSDAKTFSGGYITSGTLAASNQSIKASSGLSLAIKGGTFVTFYKGYFFRGVLSGDQTLPACYNNFSELLSPGFKDSSSVSTYEGMVIEGTLIADTLLYYYANAEFGVTLKANTVAYFDNGQNFAYGPAGFVVAGTTHGSLQQFVYSVQGDTKNKVYININSYITFGSGNMSGYRYLTSGSVYAGSSVFYGSGKTVTISGPATFNQNTLVSGNNMRYLSSGTTYGAQTLYANYYLSGSGIAVVHSSGNVSVASNSYEQFSHGGVVRILYY